MAYKQKGSPMKRNFGISPMKQEYDVHGTDKRAYKVDQDKYDNWRKESASDAPDVRYLGQKENKLHLDKFMESQKKKDEPVKESKPEYDINETDKRVYKIDQDKYDSWRRKSSPGAPDVRYLGDKKNKKYIDKYLEEEELPGIKK